MTRRRRALVGVALGLLLAAALLALFHRPLLRSVGAFLIVDEPLEPADAIVVLAGGTPFREASAARLYRRGIAPRLIISRAHTPDHVRMLLDMGIRTHDGVVESRLALEHNGVPRDRITTIQNPSRITETELRAVGHFVGDLGYRRVVLVTSPEHTRRVRLVWAREAPSTIRGLVVPAMDDPFPIDGWWRHRRIAESVLHEYLGLAAIWLGASAALE